MFGRFGGFGGKRPAGPMLGALQRRMHGWFGNKKEGQPGTGVRPMFKGGIGPFRRMVQKQEEPSTPPVKKDPNEPKE